MSLPARHTHRPHCLQPREHGFKLPAYFRYYRIHLNATLARWANLDGLADFNGRMKWPMNVDLVGEILLVALDRLQHLIRRCEFPEILRRIEGDLLCEVGIGKLLPLHSTGNQLRIAGLRSIPSLCGNGSGPRWSASRRVLGEHVCGHCVPAVSHGGRGHLGGCAVSLPRTVAYTLP